MNYILASWIPEPESPSEDSVPSYMADVPERFAPLLMASSMKMVWGVFQVEGNHEDMESAGLEFVPRELDALLSSAEMYPPAMALARDDIERAYREVDEPERTAFIRDYARALRKHLQHQAQAGYLLLEAREDEPCYIWSGQFYWVLEYLPQTGEVRWVSYDYFVYRSAARHFALSATYKQALTAG